MTIGIDHHGPVSLRVRGLSVRTRGDSPALLLDDVDLDLAPGQRVGIVGHSGAGKSMFLRALTGFCPDSLDVQGSVQLIDGSGEIQELLTADTKQRRRLATGAMAISWQNALQSLNPYQTIARQLGATLRLHRQLTADEVRSASLQWLASVGLPDGAGLLGSYPHQLSGGMRQRVAIAMTMCGGQPIVVADEPTTALDMVSQAECIDLYDRLCAAGARSLLYVSHDLALVGRLCTSVMVIQDARVVESGGIDQVFGNPTSELTRALVAHTRRVRPA